MAKKKRVLLAKEYNWGMIRSGDWTQITWQVWSDRSCDIRVEFTAERPDPLDVQVNMSEREFDRLLAAADAPWETPPDMACDGTGWSIKRFADGLHPEKNFPGPEYIYGSRQLEELTGALPSIPGGIPKQYE